MKLNLLLLFLLLFSCERAPENDNLEFHTENDAIKINISQHHLTDKTVIIIDRIYYKNNSVSKIQKSVDTIPFLGMVKDTFYVEELDKDTIINSNKNYKFYISAE